MNPPSGGPSTGAISPGQVIYEMDRIKSFFSVMRKTTNRPTGTIMAPPIPCKTRAAVNCVSVLLTPQIIEASVNNPIAEENTVARPNGPPPIRSPE